MQIEVNQLPKQVKQWFDFAKQGEPVNFVDSGKVVATLSITEEKQAENEKKGGAGSIMRAYFADVPPPNSPEEDFILPSRKDSNHKSVDFD